MAPRIDITRAMAQDDTEFVHLTVSGTHTGPYMGVPPSGRRFSVDLVDIWRFDAAGKMIEGWVICKGDIKLALEAAHATWAPDRHSHKPLQTIGR